MNQRTSKYVAAPPNQAKGFTLIEVIVVIGIIGIMSAIAIPAINSWVPNYRLKAAARDVYSAAMKAKSEAVKRNSNVAMTFNQIVDGINHVCIVYEDDNNNFSHDSGEEIVYRMENWPNQVDFDLIKGGGDGISFVNNGDGNPTITYQPNALPSAFGGAAPNGSVFLMNSNGREMSVVINRAGSIRID